VLAALPNDVLGALPDDALGALPVLAAFAVPAALAVLAALPDDVPVALPDEALAALSDDALEEETFDLPELRATVCVGVGVVETGAAEQATKPKSTETMPAAMLKRLRITGFPISARDPLRVAHRLPGS
jgi:hypothetical protein